MLTTIAIIDLGTNTFNLLIANISASTTHIIHTSKQAVKLGQSTIEQNIINTDAQQRAIKTLSEFVAICAEHKVQHINAYATSAVRNAVNSDSFCADVKIKTGVTITVIDGLTEAEFIYKGVKQTLNIQPNTNALIMDIGGGSTEFIICNQTQILWKQSFNIGIARLLVKFKPSDTITDREIAAVQNYLSSELSTLTNAISMHTPTLLVGSSGSFDTFADMLLLQQNKPVLSPNVNTYTYEIDNLKALFNTFYNSTYNQRLAMNGMLALRAEMIVLAALCTQYVIDAYNINDVRLSTYALKEGAMFSFAENLAVKNN
jgi:exopolyphosphatase / guanosine-5'-triphosphate,3'-diphosphate pyrophosphatase